MKYPLVFCILSFFATKISAHPTIDSLRLSLQKAASHSDKSAVHEQMAFVWAAEQQADSVKKQVGFMLAEAKSKNELSFLTTQLTTANKILIGTGNFDYALQLNQQYLHYFSERHHELGMAVCYECMGSIKLYTGHISEAETLLTKAYHLSKNDSRLFAEISIDLGEVYNSQSRYTDALRVLADALAIVDSAKDTKYYCGLLFTLGNTYGTINDPQTALGYFQRVRDISRKTGDVMGEANALINMASSYSHLKNYETAATYAKEALAIVADKHPMAEGDVLSVLSSIIQETNHDAGLDTIYNRMYALAALTNNELLRGLADIGMAHLAFKKKDFDKAIHLLETTLPQIEADGDWNETLPGYRLLSNSYSQKGEYKKALETLKKFYDYKDSTYNQDKIKELALLQAKLHFQKKELMYEKEQRVKNILIVSIIIIFCLILLLSFFIIKNKQKLIRQKQLMLRAELEQTAHELNIAELKLQEFTRNIQEKTKLAETMQEQLSAYQEQDHTVINQLQQSTILTEEDWMNFKSLFDKVHSGFLHRLKEKHPEISPAEIRFLTLAKLHFSTKEMAAALGVSTQSIRTNWYRIRKKLSLPESLTAEDLVAEI